MKITFTLAGKTKDGKKTFTPHIGTVLQTKKKKKEGVVIPSRVGPDGIIIPEVKKDFSFRDWFVRREME